MKTDTPGAGSDCDTRSEAGSEVRSEVKVKPLPFCPRRYGRSSSGHLGARRHEYQPGRARGKTKGRADGIHEKRECVPSRLRPAAVQEGAAGGDEGITAAEHVRRLPG